MVCRLQHIALTPPLLLRVRTTLASGLDFLFFLNIFLAGASALLYPLIPYHIRPPAPKSSSDPGFFMYRPSYFIGSQSHFHDLTLGLKMSMNRFSLHIYLFPILSF